MIQRIVFPSSSGSSSLVSVGIRPSGNRDDVFGVTTRLRAEMFRARFPAGVRDFSLVQNHGDPASCLMGTVALPKGKSGRGVMFDLSCPSNAEIKNERSYTSTLSIFIKCVDKETFPYLFLSYYLYIYYILFILFYILLFICPVTGCNILQHRCKNPNVVLPVCLPHVLRLGIPTALALHNSYQWRGSCTLPLHFIHDMQPLLFSGMTDATRNSCIT